MSERTPPIRVTLVGPTLDFLGGQAIQAQRLLKRLATLPQIQPTFLAVNPRLPGPLRALQRVKYIRTIATSIAYQVSLLRKIRNTDVVHAFSASYWAFLLAPLPAMLYGRLFGRAVLLNYRSGEAEDHLRRWGFIAIPAMRLAHAIVVPSGYLVDVFARFGLRARAVFNFVETDQLPYRKREVLRPIFLSNRNFEAHYNVASVLRAFGRIQQAYPNASLAVVGDGKLRGELHALARALGLRHLDFVGPVPPARMGEYYQAADVYLNAPSIDNMPNSVIEAFAAGLPVVTSDAGGIPYIVRHEENGLLVPAGDDEALANGALRLLREPGLALRLSTNAREECLHKYTWEAVSKEWERCYRDVVGSTPAGA